MIEQMKSIAAKKEVRTAEKGKLHIHVTIKGAGVEREELEEAFNITVESIRGVRRKLRKCGIEGVSYRIEKSDG